MPGNFPTTCKQMIPSNWDDKSSFGMPHLDSSQTSIWNKCIRASKQPYQGSDNSSQATDTHTPHVNNAQTPVIYHDLRCCSTSTVDDWWLFFQVFLTRPVTRAVSNVSKQKNGEGRSERKPKKYIQTSTTTATIGRPHVVASATSIDRQHTPPRWLRISLPVHFLGRPSNEQFETPPGVGFRAEGLRLYCIDRCDDVCGLIQAAHFRGSKVIY